MVNDLKSLIGNRAVELEKECPYALDYMKRHYVADENEDMYGFDISSNDNILTRSLFNGEDLHKCHVKSHINCDREWALKKMRDFFDKVPNGTDTPTWFESEEDISNCLEALFIKSKYMKQLKCLERWIMDRDIYYNDKTNSRFAINLVFDDSIGYGMATRTDYSKKFECHGVRLVFEYTLSHEDGEFAVFDAYPFFTKEDWSIVNEARKQWMDKRRR